MTGNHVIDNFGFIVARAVDLTHPGRNGVDLLGLWKD